MSKDKTHWLQSPNKNYLGHWDLPETGELTLTIKSASWESVKNPITNTSEAKRVIRFIEAVKPMICNQTNAQRIIKSTGVKYMEDSSGSSITLYIDKIIDKRTKEELDCIRVKPHNPYNLERLRDLFKQKRSKLTPEWSERIDEIINNKEQSSYQKSINELVKL